MTKTNFIGIKNSTNQSVAVGGAIDLGAVYRKFVTRCPKGLLTFETNGENLTLQHSGFYKITAVVTFTAPTAGDVTLQFAENGIPILGATATETITTASTEFRTITLDYLFVVSKGFVENSLTNLIKNISIISSAIPITVTNVIVNAVKL